MKIKSDSDGSLSLNKTIKISIVTKIVRAIFHGNNKYYRQIFLYECLYKKQKCYIMIELTFSKHFNKISAS